MLASAKKNVIFFRTATVQLCPIVVKCSFFSGRCFDEKKLLWFCSCCYKVIIVICGMAVMTEINKMKVSSARYSSHKMNISHPITQLVKYTKLMLNFTWALKPNVPYFEQNLLRRREKKKKNIYRIKIVNMQQCCWLKFSQFAVFNVHIHIWYCNSDSFYFGEWRDYTLHP